MADEVGQSVPGLQAQTAQMDYGTGAAPSTMLQGSTEVRQQLDNKPLQSGVDKDAFDPNSKPKDSSTKKCSGPPKSNPLIPGVPKLDNLRPPKSGGKRPPPLKGGTNKGGTNPPPLKGGTGNTHPNPPLKGGTDTTHPKPDPHLVPDVPKPDQTPKNPPINGGTDTTPEIPKDTPKKPIPPGVNAITPKEWQDEKCRTLAYLQRHMRGGANPLTDLKHWLLDSIFQGYNAAGSFDSKYGIKGANQQNFMFESGPMAGKVLSGAEVNYYFQGMIAAAFGKTPQYLEDRIRSWKENMYHTVPSPATLAMAKLGYDSYQQDIEDCKKAK